MVPQQTTAITQLKKHQLSEKWANLPNPPLKSNIRDTLIFLNSVTNFEPLLLDYFIKKQQVWLVSQLPSQPTFDSVFQLFLRFETNLDSLEDGYAVEGMPLIESNPTQQQKQQQQSFYASNRANIGNYLRDNAQHLQKLINKYHSPGDLPNNKTIPASSLGAFMKDLFSYKHITFLKDASQTSSYFVDPTINSCLHSLMVEYYHLVKQIPPEQYNQMGAYLAEDQVLDFVEFWIRKDTNLCVLYRLTSKGLTRAINLVNQRHDRKLQKINGIPEMLVHTNEQLQFQQQKSPAKRIGDLNKASPDKLQKSVIKNSNKTTKTEQAESQQSPLKDGLLNSLQNTIRKYELMMAQAKNEEERTALLKMLITLDEQYRTLSSHDADKSTRITSEANTVQLVSSHTLQPRSQKSKSTTTSDFQTKFQEIFYTYCRRRYAVSKHTTFDMIEHESKTMNFEKFYDFCTDYQVGMERELLRDHYKKSALNQRELNYERFIRLMETLYAAKPQLRQNLIKNVTRITKLDQSKIVKVEPLAKYEFKIIPHSGKTEEEIRDELRVRRETKEVNRQQQIISRLRQEISYLNKVGMRHKAIELIETNARKKKDLSLNFLIPAERQREKLTIQNLDKFKDKNFDPSSIVDNADDDEYLTYFKLTEPPQSMMEHSISTKAKAESTSKVVAPGTSKSRTITSQHISNTSPGESPKRRAAISKREYSEIKVREIQDQAKSKQNSIVLGVLRNRDQKIETGLKVLRKYQEREREKSRHF